MKFNAREGWVKVLRCPRALEETKIGHSPDPWLSALSKGEMGLLMGCLGAGIGYALMQIGTAWDMVGLSSLVISHEMAAGYFHPHAVGHPRMQLAVPDTFCSDLPLIEVVRREIYREGVPAADFILLDSRTLRFEECEDLAQLAKMHNFGLWVNHQLPRAESSAPTWESVPSCVATVLRLRNFKEIALGLPLEPRDESNQTP